MHTGGIRGPHRCCDNVITKNGERTISVSSGIFGVDFLVMMSLEIFFGSKQFELHALHALEGGARVCTANADHHSKQWLFESQTLREFTLSNK